MNTSEMKLDLFRKIDSLESYTLEKVYNEIISLLNNDQENETTTMTPELKKALDEALKESEQGKTYTNKEVNEITRKKYPKLFR